MADSSWITYYVNVYTDAGHKKAELSGHFTTRKAALKHVAALRSRGLLLGRKYELVEQNNTPKQNPARVPVGKKIRVNWIRQNRNGSITLSVPARSVRNPRGPWKVVVSGMVGKNFPGDREGFGKVQAIDIGKKFYIEDGAVYIENNQQRDARLGRRK